MIPEGFNDWSRNMDTWGTMMVESAFSAAEMAAVGMGLDKGTFVDRMK